MHIQFVEVKDLPVFHINRVRDLDDRHLGIAAQNFRNVFRRENRRDVLILAVDVIAVFFGLLVF